MVGNQNPKGINGKLIESGKGKAGEFAFISVLQNLLHVDAMLDARFQEEPEGISWELRSRSDHDAVVTKAISLFEHLPRVDAVLDARFDEDFERAT